MPRPGSSPSLSSNAEVFVLDFMGRVGREVTVDDIMVEADDINNGTKYSLLARSGPRARSSVSRALSRLKAKGLVGVSRSVVRRAIPEVYWVLTDGGRKVLSEYWKEVHAIEAYAPALFADIPCGDCTLEEECWKNEMKRLGTFLEERLRIRLSPRAEKEIRNALGAPSRVKQMIAIYTFFPDIEAAKRKYDMLLERLVEKGSVSASPPAANPPG